MLQNNDILEVTYSSGFGDGEPFAYNVFGYKATNVVNQDDIDMYQLVFGSLDNDLIEPITNIMSAATGFFGCRVKNLTNGLDFSEFLYSPYRVGSVNQEALPQFVSWGFQLNRATLATRNGSKRILGVNENWQVNGTVVAGQASLEAAAIAMGSVVLGDDGLGNTVTLSPVIIRKSSTGALVLTNPVQSASFKRITSQTSRKD